MSTKYLKTSGVLSYITPNNWLTINTNKDLREFILKKSNIIIVNFYDKVFETASVDSSIIIYQNSINSPDIVSLYNYENSFELIKKSSTEFFNNIKDFVINIELLKNESNFKLINKIENNSNFLNDFASIKVGLKAYQRGKGNPKQTNYEKENRIFHSKDKLSDDYFAYIDGRDVGRYTLGWSGEFLKYGDHLAEPRKNFDLFSTERILIRQIPSQPPYCINAVLTDEIVLNDLNSMNVIYIKIEPKFLLGVLNSRLISFWFELKFGKLQRGIFPQFKINELKTFPVAETSSDNSKVISNLVDQILTAKKANPQADTTALEAEIDQLVYKLYGLTEEEIKIVEESVG